MKRILCSLFAVLFLITSAGFAGNAQGAYDADIEKITQNAIDEFLAITKVPRPSYHLSHILDYLTEYAQAHSFECAHDDYGNFWMDIPASAGCENVPKVILQAHMDMVFASERGYEIDPENTGITAIREGNTITADRTSLGADDGIGIGIIMAIITSDVPHGPIRVLITADEEVGLLGADALPAEVLDAEYLINVDNEETNQIICSTAGLFSSDCEKQCSTNDLPDDYEILSFTIDGLRGGHSGVDIDKNRLSAAEVLIRILETAADEKIPFMLGSIDGGTTHNAIAPFAKAVIAVPKVSSERVKEIIEEAADLLRSEYPDENLTVSVSGNTPEGITFISQEDSLDYLSLLSFIPQGVIAMSKKIDGLVQTSSNTGLFSVDNGKCLIGRAIRSCVTEEQDQLHSQLEAKNEELGYSMSVIADYPGWDGDPNTRLIKLISAGFKKATGEETDIVPIHAGLECSWFSRKHEGIQLASIGPRIHNPHTVNETLYVDTIRPCVEAIVYTLGNIGVND